MTILFNAGRRIRNPLPGTGVMDRKGTVRRITSDGFSGTGPLAGRLSDIAQGGKPIGWYAIPGDEVGLSVAGGQLVQGTNPKLSTTVLEMPSTVGEKMVTAQLRIRTVPTSVMYLAARRDRITSPTSQARLFINGPEAMISYNSGGQSANPGDTKFTYAPGDILGIQVNGRLIEAMKNGTVVSQFLAPEPIFGFYSAIILQAALTFVADDFTLDSTVV